MSLVLNRRRDLDRPARVVIENPDEFYARHGNRWEKLFLFALVGFFAWLVMR